MGSLKPFFVAGYSWVLFFLIFFLVVVAAVWLTPCDSGCPPPGDYTITQVTRVTGLSRDWYNISFRGKDGNFKISSSRISVEMSESSRRATLSVDKDDISLKLPTDFEVRQESLLLSVVCAAFTFSLVATVLFGSIRKNHRARV